MKDAFASGTEGKFETEAEFLASHRKIVHQEAQVALTTLFYICAAVAALMLASKVFHYFKKRGGKRQD